MSVTVERYTEDHREEWEQLVADAPDGTLFHRRAFLDYHPEDRFDERSLLFYYKGEHLLGVLPLAYDESPDGTTVARSPYGASYGGLALEPGCKFRYVGRVVDALLEVLDDDVDRVEIRPTPREQSVSPSAYQEFHYDDAGFEIADREVTSALDLQRFGDDPFDVYESRCRRAVRKARKEGVRVEADTDDWAAFHEILSETLDRHGKEPTHSLAELRDLARLVPDRLRLSVATLDGEPIAGILAFLLNDTTDQVFYNCHRSEYRDYNPVNLLLDSEIRWANEQGFRYVDQGTSVENHEWNDGLVKFKESFGTVGHFRTVYERTL